MGEREDMLAQFGAMPIPTPGLMPRPLPGGPGLGNLEAAAQQQARAEAFAKLVAPPDDSPEAWRQGAEALGYRDAVRDPNDPRVPQFGGTIPRKETMVGRDHPAEAMPPKMADTSAPSLQPMVTPQVDVAPARTLASMGSPGIASGMGAGGGGFGNLEKNLHDAQGRQLKGYADAGDLEREKGIDEALKAQGMSDTYEAHASRLEQQADDQRAVDELTAQKHDAFMAQQEKLANDLAKQQVDPGRLLRNADTATQLTFGLGAALGGGNAMLNGQNGNGFLDRIDKLVDRDINAQIQDIDSKKASYNARSTLFGQMMSESGDRRLAAMQTRKLMYDAMAQKVLSDGERLGIPILKDNAAIIAQTFTQKGAELQTQIAQTALQQARAAAAAAVAAQRAAEDRAWQRQKDMIQLDLEQQKVDVSREGKSKETGDRRVVLDGKDDLAVNKEAAGKWNEYNHGRAVFSLALDKLKAAREAGDVGAYDAARAQLIEEYPKLLGYTRAPTEGQISHTVGPNAIPEYNHWFNHAKYGPVGAATYKRDQGRGEEKIKFLEETLATSDKAMRENTFGAKAGISPHFKPDAQGEGKK